VRMHPPVGVEGEGGEVQPQIEDHAHVEEGPGVQIEEGEVRPMVFENFGDSGT
jgi:hypothetical protein